jgi:hypothetical protein
VIGLPSGTRVWIVAGHTDMRKGFDGLAAMVQTALAANPFCVVMKPAGFLSLSAGAAPVLSLEAEISLGADPCKRFMSDMASSGRPPRN